MDNAIHVGAIAYGLLLVASVFVRTRLTEALRIDTLFMPGTGEKTRFLNLVFGALIAGYGAWSLWGAR